MRGKATFFLLASAGISQAATLPAATAPQPPPCESAPHHQLDFWVGEWAVFQVSDDKTQIATSRIESVMAGCGIRENYAAPSVQGAPYAGTSYSGYDRKDGKWHQMYVDTNGNVTWYTGSLEGADMVLTAPGKQGALQKMTYHPGGDGTVRQTGAASIDGGKTWQPGYDYIYRKK